MNFKRFLVSKYFSPLWLSKNVYAFLVTIVRMIQMVRLFGFNVAFNIICHITTVSGGDRELNAHFYSAASLWYQIPDTFT